MKNKALTLLIIILILLFAFNKSYSQFGVQFSYIKPTSTMGYYFKPTLGAEIFYKFNEEDNKFVLGVSLGFYPLNTRLDTFTNYTVKISNGSNSLIPGYKIYSKYYVVSFGLTSEYKFLLTKLTPLVGLDLNANINSYDYKEKIETLLDKESYNENSFDIAIIPRLGVRYEININWVISAGIGKSIGIVSEAGSLSYWKTYTNIIYFF